MRLKNSVIWFFALLLYVCSFLLDQPHVDQGKVLQHTDRQELVSYPEIQASERPLNLGIEVNNSFQVLTEVHKLSSGLVFINRIVPLNFNFRTITEIPSIINISTRVPIFILGHVLRH